MQPKKNPKADLNKNRNLYFVIGLTFVTFITWQAIESKTYEKTFDYEALNVEDDDDEDIPITEQIKTPPPPPPPRSRCAGWGTRACRRRRGCCTRS